MRTPVLAALLLAPCLAVAAPWVPDTTGSPRMEGVANQAGSMELLPLKDHRADVEILGPFAHVRMTQTYVNTGGAALTATYVFPASTRAAVHTLVMTVGDRRIRAVVQQRDAARAAYTKARELGQTASLLEQDRPNVFCMRVANIQAGQTVVVELEYVEQLTPTDGQYSFVLPAAVGPRFQSAHDDPSAPAEPLRTKNAPYTCDVALRFSTPTPVTEVSSRTHTLGVSHDVAGGTQVVLDGADREPGNRDLQVDFRLASQQLQSGAQVHTNTEGSTMLAMVQPPARPAHTDIAPREYIFVVDVSGSMHGRPLETAANLVRNLAQGLGPADRFNVVLFESEAYTLAPRSVSASATQVNAAVNALAQQRGGGGTQLVDALRTALAIPRAPDMSRTLLLVTDGYVNVEQQALALVRDNLQDTSVFVFGIGSSVNRHLVESVARAGAGEAFVVTHADDAKDMAARFWQYVRSPVLTHVEVRVEGMQATDIIPRHIPVVFASRPITVMAHLAGGPTGTLVITGQSASGPVELRTPLHLGGGGSPALPLLWARQRLQELTDQMEPGNQAAHKHAIVEVALRHGLLSPYTSFVAVDDMRHGAVGVEVLQPAVLPQGMDGAEATGGAFGALHGVGAGGGGMGYGRGGLGVRGVGVAHKAMPRVMGSMDTGSLAQALTGRQRAVQRCYERALAAGATAEGKMVLKVELDAQGKVTRLTVVKDSLGLPQVTRCVRHAFMRLRTPKNHGGGTSVVTWPLVFKKR